MRVGHEGMRGLGPRAMLVLILVLAGLDVAAPQHMSAGVENKAGATIPSFAISGRDAVVAVHGPFNACADCGHFWTTISRARLDRALACGDRDRVAGERLQRQ